MIDQASPPLAPRASLRWSVVKRLVDELNPTDILELGCGLGGFGTRLAQGRTYTAAEPDDECWQVAHDRITAHGGTVIHGDHNKVPEGKQYGLVCAFEVLEHISDDAAALAEWVPLVKPGGHILLSVPADPTRFGPSDTLAGHFRRYTAEELTARLTEAGCTDVRIIHYGWPLAYILDTVRNQLASRSMHLRGDTEAERTAGSGRLFQPRRKLSGAVIKAGVAPFAVIQRAFPSRGPALVAVARRPETA